jgi:hypothetical protein
MASFVQHGFHVRLWCYRPLDVPVGVEVSDASTILPESDIGRFTQAGVKGSVTSFSNLFRYTLLAQHGGWWFDSDVLCLKPSDQFFTDREYVFGYSRSDVVASGIMKIPSSFAQIVCDEAVLIGNRNNWTFHWGEIGPQLFTSVAKREGVIHHACPASVFIPIAYFNALLALDPDRAEEVEITCEHSHTYHFFNEILRQNAIPKALMPPVGSYLHSQFIRFDPSLATLPALPVKTFRKLCVKPLPMHSIKFLSRSLWSLVKRRYFGH